MFHWHQLLCTPNLSDITFKVNQIPAASGGFCACQRKKHSRCLRRILRILPKDAFLFWGFAQLNKMPLSLSPLYLCIPYFCLPPANFAHITQRCSPPPHRGAMFPTVISPLEVPERRRFGAGKHRKEAPYFQFLKSRLVPFQIICTRKTRHQSICLDNERIGESLLL